jgi:threonine/homoserine/homoserine lactone efflux protein
VAAVAGEDHLVEVTPIVHAALTGFVSGLLVCIPVGPINVTIINEGARRGFKWALLIGLGASLMEVIYCAIAFTGFASFFSRGYVKAAMELTSFIFMLYLGIKFLTTKSVGPSPQIMPDSIHIEERIEMRIEEKLHPHSAFMTGFVRVMANAGVLVFWIILAANFISREWVDVDYAGTRTACVAGVAAGTSLWFAGLSWAVSLGHRKFSQRTLLIMERISGISLLALAVAHGTRIIWLMSHHQM